MTVSPDSKRIAYAWYNKEKGVDLRIVDLDELEPRVLYRGESAEAAWPVAWSPEGADILVMFTSRASVTANATALPSMEDSNSQCTTYREYSSGNMIR